MQLEEALKGACALIAPEDARVLLEAATGRNRASQIAHPEYALTEEEANRYGEWVRARQAGMPVAYLVGYREFFGEAFKVSPAVLIPRPETECLVEVAQAVIAQHRGNRPMRVLELGTGSGIIALTLARRAPAAEITATDISSQALTIAQENQRRLGLRVRWILSDWFEALRHERFDLVVSNPPYIAVQDHHLDQGDLRFEPRGALTDGSPEGLGSLARIIQQAPDHVVPGGQLWLEHGFDQAQACRTLLEKAGFENVTSYRDLAGIERVSGGARGGRL
jgi:release factor glutamine methyltransferase